MMSAVESLVVALPRARRSQDCHWRRRVAAAALIRIPPGAASKVTSVAGWRQYCSRSLWGIVT
jgi:hypothetical protein